MAQVIRVNPASVRSYGARADEEFQSIRNQMQGLVDDVVNVNYQGPNAVKIKTTCGQMAQDFTQQLSKDVAAIASAVQTATSNISGSLGGTPVTISVNTAPISPPSVPAAPDFVQVDPGALTALTGTVTSHMTAIDSALDDHLSALQSTDWTGNAKDEAVSAVSQFTSAAKTQTQTAQSQINSYLNAQAEATLKADK